MLNYVLSVFILFFLILPISYFRKNIITENEVFGVFVGNYIYFSLQLLVLAMILLIVHSFFYKIKKNQIKQISIVWLFFTGFVGYYEYRFSDVVYQPVKIEKKVHMKNFRVVFISDLHLNSNSNKSIFTEAVEKINKLDADIIFVGGDLFQDTYEQVPKDFENIFSNLKSNHGSFLIMGNHEYYGENVDENIQYANKMGFKTLIDDKVVVNDIQFIGRDDKYTEDRPSLESLYNTLSIDENKPIILIDHSPVSIKESKKNGVDLQLSGHTHAGQFFPFSLVTGFIYDNSWGFKKFGDLQTIVSAGLGVGYWRKIGAWQMPYRFGTDSEINVIDLTFNNE